MAANPGRRPWSDAEGAVVRFEAWTLVLLLSAAVSGVVAALAWHRRAWTPAATGLVVFMLGSMLWAGTEGIGRLLAGSPAQRFLVLLGTPASAVTASGFFWLCRVMIDRDAAANRRLRLLLCVEPAVITLAALTNGLHGWVFAAMKPSNTTGYMVVEPGPLFVFHVVYCYGLFGWACVAVARAWRTASELHRRQLAAVLVSAVVPLAATVPMLAEQSDAHGGLDFAAMGFLITGLIIWWALFRQGMLRLVPVTRAEVLDRISDAIIVADQTGKILDLNPALLSLHERIQARLPADPDTRAFLETITSERMLAGGPPVDGEYLLPLVGGTLYLDVRSTPLADRRGNPIGSVIVLRDVTELSEHKHRLTQVNVQLRQQVAMIDRLRADLAEQAVRDPLTGLHNRRHLMARLEQLITVATASDEPFGVVLLDLDRFKTVNDRFGHATGDLLLVAAAGMLTGSTRQGDTVARYGGEEFIVLLPGATAEQSRCRAEQWRERPLEVAVTATDGRPAPGVAGVTFSAGVAAFPAHGRTPEALLKAADEALYAAKAAGRDRVIVAGAPGTAAPLTAADPEAQIPLLPADGPG